MTAAYGQFTGPGTGDSKRNLHHPRAPVRPADEDDGSGGDDDDTMHSASGAGSASVHKDSGSGGGGAGAGAGAGAFLPFATGAGAGIGTPSVTSAAGGGGIAVALQLPDALASLYSVQAQAALARAQEALDKRAQAQAAKAAESKQREADSTSIKSGTKLRVLYDFVVQLCSTLDVREVDSVWDWGKDAKTNPLWQDKDLDVESDFESGWKKHVQPYWSGKIVSAMVTVKGKCARNNPSIARASAWDFMGTETAADNLCRLIRAAQVRTDARWKRLRTLNDNDAAEEEALAFFDKLRVGV